jgi:signal recognition particle receptor subunit beta
MLLAEEKEQLRVEAEKKKIDKQALKVVKQTDICLFCNLQDLFTKYEYEDNREVLQPRQVRKSLEEIFIHDFAEGKMGCAQETLIDIL